LALTAYTGEREEIQMARHRWNGTNQGNGLMAAAAALSAAMAQGKTA